MKFMQNFEQDLNVFLEGYMSRPFCFVRFGDGEGAILRKRELPFKTHRQGENWDSKKILPEVMQALRLSLCADLDDYYIGVICPGCSKVNSVYLREHIKCSLERQTFAEIFGNANWKLLQPALKMLRDQCFLVSSSVESDLRIPTNLPEHSLSEHEKIVEQLRDVTKPIALAAGPSSCILGYLYWTSPSSKPPQTCVDVGALFDPLYWGNTRLYMPKNSRRGERICTWDGVGVGLDTN